MALEICGHITESWPGLHFCLHIPHTQNGPAASTKPDQIPCLFVGRGSSLPSPKNSAPPPSFYYEETEINERKALPFLPGGYLPSISTRHLLEHSNSNRHVQHCWAQAQGQPDSSPTLKEFTSALEPREQPEDRVRDPPVSEGGGDEILHCKTLE